MNVELIGEQTQKLYDELLSSSANPTELVEKLDQMALAQRPMILKRFAETMFAAGKAQMRFEVVLGLPGAGKSLLNQLLAEHPEFQDGRRVTSVTGTGGVTKPTTGSVYEEMFGPLKQLTDAIKQMGIEEDGNPIYYRGEMITNAILLDHLRLFAQDEVTTVVGDVFPRRTEQVQILNDLTWVIQEYYQDNDRVIDIRQRRVFVVRASKADVEILNGMQLHPDFILAMKRLSFGLNELRQDIEKRVLEPENLDDAIEVLSDKLNHVVVSQLAGQAQTIAIIWVAVIMRSLKQGLRSRIEKAETRSDNDVSKFLIRLASDFKNYTAMLSERDFLVSFIANDAGAQELVSAYLSLRI